MAGRRRIYLLPCLALVCIFFYTWSFLNELLWPSHERFRILAQDTLRAACDSAHEAMLSLLEAHENELRTKSEQNAIDRLGTKFKRLEASLDDLLQESPLRKTALEELSSPRSVKGRHITDMHQTDMCGSLAGKRITMIGSEHIYRLHLLLLQHREHAEGKLFPCPYHEFCTHHHICLPNQHFREVAPPPRYIKSPTTQELIETESAVVNYIVSDTLLSARDQSSWEYTLPFVDPVTGVRLRETYWLAAARKANVVILGRGPLSAPGQTYTGNWSFLRHVPDYVDKSRAAIAGEYKDHDDVPMYQMVLRSMDILNVAVHLTVSRFLPHIFQLLQSVLVEVRPSRRKQLIWPSNWYRLPGRGSGRTALLHPHARSKVKDTLQQTFLHYRRSRSPAEHILTLQLSALINADITNTALLEDPWTLLFNAQGEHGVITCYLTNMRLLVYLQNILLRELLPRYGIVFLPLNLPWVGAQDRGHGHGYPHDVAVGVDLERTEAIGEAFLTGLDYVLRFLE